MMQRLWLFFIAAVSTVALARAETQKEVLDILVLPKAHGSTVRKLRFSSLQAKQKYLKSVNRAKIRVEDLVKFRGDSLRFTSQGANPPLPVPDEPLSYNEWSLFPIAPDAHHLSGANIDVLRAWTITKSAPHVYVLVLDSGIDDSDSDLAGRVYAQFDALNPGKAPVDENGHGTQVTSIFAASGTNHAGMIGIVPGEIHVIDGRFLDATKTGNSADALTVLQFFEQEIVSILAADPAAHFIITNSWGGSTESQLVTEEFQKLTASDVLTLSSAGNNSSSNDTNPYYPCNSQILANTCVGASGHNDELASFSSFGPSSVHLLAPGVGIYGIVPPPKMHAFLDGTSQAVPHATGVAALVWATNPGLTALQVHEILLRSVDPIPKGKSYVVSGGRLNAYRAVLLAAGKDPSELEQLVASSQLPSSSSSGCSLMPSASLGCWNVLQALLLFAVILLHHQAHRARSKKNW